MKSSSSSLQARARAELERRRRARARLHLLDFVPHLTPRWERPDHLAPFAQAFERIKAGEAIRLLVSVPPQHGKTELELHGIAQLLLVRPDRANAFVSYAADYANSKSRQARDYARKAGVSLRDDSQAVHEWRTREGGGLLATGVGGPLTGHGIGGVLVIDDPFKNREEAESQAHRDKVHEWHTSTAMTRVHETTSVIVCHTRWHPDDLIGRLQAETKTLADGQTVPRWENINLPAINEAGAALWPKHRPLSLLEERRSASEYDWWSMYMGAPRPRGGEVFRGVVYCDAPPDSYRVAIGIDLAYTAKTHADYSAAVVLAEWGGTYYVLDVRREQCEAPVFADTLRQLQASYPGAKMLWHASATERGMADWMREQSGFPIAAELAKADKFIRAQPVAAAWNAGRVQLPRTAPWLPTFVGEVGKFTGISDRHDDQVDALSSAFAALSQPAVDYDLTNLPEY